MKEDRGQLEGGTPLEPEEIKKYFRQIRDERNEIRIVEMLAEETRRAADLCNAEALEAVRGRLADLKRTARGLERRQRSARAILDTLEDEREREVIERLYFSDSRENMESIAAGMSYSERAAWQIYKRAIQHIAEGNIRQ